MDAKVISMYRGIYTDLKLDWGESEELKTFLQDVNPPPDKLVWLRATAFRIGCEFLYDSNDKNVALLRAINAVVHVIETTCMKPKNTDEDGSFDGEKVEEFYNGLFSDLSIDQEENQELFSFFNKNRIPASALVQMRAFAFKTGVNYLSDDRERNISLLRCINVTVHAFEKCCMSPKTYELKLPEAIDFTMNLQDAIQYLWNLDVNRLTPNRDYRIDVQKSKKPYWKEDKADDPLFQYVDKLALDRPTYKSFIALLDNYIAETGVAEVVTHVERKEVQTFLDNIMETGPMQFCQKYCHHHKPNDVPSSKSSFKELLHKIWFQLYGRTRGTRGDSSGFEHVFVGEVKDNKITGFHNWIQFYIEEKKGTVDYRGYVKPKGRNQADSDSDDHVLSLQFTWNGVEKFVGTSFIGTSPEFEMALYTICFLIGDEDNEIELNTGTDVFDINIKCYRMARDKLGTSFPETKSHHK